MRCIVRALQKVSAPGVVLSNSQGTIGVELATLDVAVGEIHYFTFYILQKVFFLPKSASLTEMEQLRRFKRG